MTVGGGVLAACEREVPIALPGEVVVRVRVCGVCEIDVLIADGALPPVEVPIIPGHEIVGIVDVVGDGVTGLQIGDRVGVSRLGHTCGGCEYCASGRENLCGDARFTGSHMDGGCAEYVVADAAYAFKLPAGYTDTEAAPLLCAGATGYRAYRMAGKAQRIGLYGGGPAPDLIAQVAAHHQRDSYVVTKGAPPPVLLDAAIVVGGDGSLVADAIGHLAPGGVVVCAGTVMSDIPSLSYRRLADERAIRTVTHLTREDVRDFVALAATVPLRTRVQTYPLTDANRALADLRAGRVAGSAALVISS